MCAHQATDDVLHYVEESAKNELDYLSLENGAQFHWGEQLLGQFNVESNGALDSPFHFRCNKLSFSGHGPVDFYKNLFEFGTAGAEVIAPADKESCRQCHCDIIRETTMELSRNRYKKSVNGALINATENEIPLKSD